jgi:hypothetical protein
LNLIKSSTRRSHGSVNRFGWHWWTTTNADSTIAAPIISSRRIEFIETRFHNPELNHRIVCRLKNNRSQSNSLLLMADRWLDAMFAFLSQSVTDRLGQSVLRSENVRIGADGQTRVENAVRQECCEAVWIVIESILDRCHHTYDPIPDIC